MKSFRYFLSSSLIFPFIFFFRSHILYFSSLFISILLCYFLIAFYFCSWTAFFSFLLFHLGFSHFYPLPDLRSCVCVCVHARCVLEPYSVSIKQFLSDIRASCHSTTGISIPSILIEPNKKMAWNFSFFFSSSKMKTWWNLHFLR